VQSQLKLAAAQVNFWTCLVIIICLLITVIRLERTHRNSEYRFLYYSMLTWLMGWIIWAILWGVASTFQFQPGDRWSILVSLLSDLNTVCFILTYIGITRGQEFFPTQYLLYGLLLIVAVGGIDIALLRFPEGKGGLNVGPILQERWSLALSMLSPILLGWAFRLRYATIWVLVAGVAYAFLQPPAYQALFSESFEPEVGAAILSILSMLKVGYAFSVLSYVASTPSSAKSLVQSPIKLIKDQMQDPTWQFVRFGLLIVGCTVVILTVRFRDLQVAWSAFASIVVYVLTIGGLVKAVEAIGKIVSRKDQTDANTKTTGIDEK